jgi:hypothetical protein
MGIVFSEKFPGWNYGTRSIIHPAGFGAQRAREGTRANVASLVSAESPTIIFSDSSFGATKKIFMGLILHIKLAPDQENSEYFMRLGNTALSQYGGCPGGGGEAPKNVFELKNR